LLIGKIIVGGQKNIETGFLGDAQQVAVCQGIPSLLKRRS